jgi:poly-gamma-glutamate capsule biosynthesis protein CapA/YwtB (metallophosphatase superfamily)
MIYGSQAHQIQQVVFYKNKPIYYGLGNFLFDQIHRIGVRQAFFLQNYFYRGKLIATKPVFTFMAATRQPSIATEAQEWAMKKLVYQ